MPLQLFENQMLVLAQSSAPRGEVGWRCPSNLAIVKYWGKHGRQLPRNPSVSLTLQNAHTETFITYQRQADTSDIRLDFYFEGQPKEAFKAKIARFLESITPHFPFLRQLHLTIHSRNSFPHSSGIASSASSMAALALCLCSIERELFGSLTDEGAFFQKASFIARLGSGSASRSVYPVAAAWGQLAAIPASSDLFAVPLAAQTHPIFHRYHDAILIADKGEKSVSSRAGHALMEGNPYAQRRYAQARERCTDLTTILQTGDAEAFGILAEDEAMTLHALMMCSKPSYMLMKPNSLAMIEKVRTWRMDTRLPLYFSLDAGPNLHLLFSDEIAEQALGFIQAELVSLCQDRAWIHDRIGNGAQRLYHSDF